VILFPSRVTELSIDDTESVYVPTGRSDQLVALKLPLAFTSEVGIVDPELFLTEIVAHGVPVPENTTLVAFVPHVRTIFDTGEITGAV
jgi:hypothetical protein